MNEEDRLVKQADTCPRCGCKPEINPRWLVEGDLGNWFNKPSGWWLGCRSGWWGLATDFDTLAEAIENWNWHCMRAREEGDWK